MPDAQRGRLRMPIVTLHQGSRTYTQEVPVGSNLVVLAGIKKFPYLRYGCGMGKCTRCRVKVLAGMEQFPEPNWKEQRLGEEKLREGWRLACQLTIQDDLEILQEELAKRT
jgi:ferredoxin